MKAITKHFLTFLFLLTVISTVQSQDHLIKGGESGYTNSDVVEGSDLNIGIGLTAPSAKLHISSTLNSRPLLKIDAWTTGSNSSLFGSLECWKYAGSIYYGIYQTQYGTVAPKNYFQNYLGLGVVSPNYQLDVNGIIGCTGSNATGIRISNTNQPFVFQYFSTSGSSQQDSGDEGDPVDGDTTLIPLTIYSYGAKVQNYLECTNILTTQSLKIKNNPHIGSVFMCDTQAGNGIWTDPSTFSITDGHVGIGIVNNLSNYKLAVDGNVICEELKVKLSGNWSDYVFQEDYNLRPLKEVERFISINKHLPEVPTTKEVAENGFNVGEMNALMLKKIEELTLYIIALQKEVDQLKTKTVSR